MAEIDLYHIPKAQKDITRFIFVGMGAFVMIALLSTWFATEYAAWALGYIPALGAPMSGHVYFPFDIIVWTWKYNNPTYGTDVMHVFAHAHLIMGIGAFFSLVIPVAIVYRRSRKTGAERNDLYGSAHWASADEVQAAGVLPDEKNRGGVLFGAFEDKKGLRYLRHKGPEHIMVFAPTRSGKGVGIVIPTLLNWDQSVLVLDIKGENWALTSGYRQQVLKQRTLKFDPTSVDSARFNPLQEIRIDGNLVKDVQNIATMIVDPNGEGLKDHWAKTGFDLMTGVVLFVLLCEPPKGKTHVDRCIATVLGILSDGGIFRADAQSAADAAAEQGKDGSVVEGARAVLSYIRDIAHAKLKMADQGGRLSKFSVEHDARLAGWMAVAQSMQSWLNKPNNEAGSVLSTALSFLSLYRDPVVAENTRVSDFSIESLMGGMNPDGQVVDAKTSFYLVVPPSDKDRLKPLLRLVISQAVRRLTEGMEFDAKGAGKSKFPHRLLLLIDEFPSLGKLEIFQEALAFIAGYGLKALLIVQDLTQLNAAYTKDESIVSNCHIRIAYAPNKIETAKLLSDMCGISTVEHTQRQYSGNRLAILLQNVNTNEQIVQRPLLTADECMRLPPDDEMVFVAGFSPIYCKKIKYYQDAALAERIKLGAASTTGRGV